MRLSGRDALAAHHGVRAGGGDATPSARNAVGLGDGGPGAVYLLVFNDPEAPIADFGLGWTLVAPGEHRSLACYGAGAHVGPQRAQAAAAEVLAAHRVQVARWQAGAGPARLMYRAIEVHPAAVAALPGAGATLESTPDVADEPGGQAWIPRPRRAEAHPEPTTATVTRWSDSAPWMG